MLGREANVGNKEGITGVCRNFSLYFELLADIGDYPPAAVHVYTR